MSDTFGSIDLRGWNQGTANGGDIALGPFGIPMGSSGVIAPAVVVVNAEPFHVPDGANGVCIVPPQGNTTGLGITGIDATPLYTDRSVIPISPVQPTLIEFDTSTPNVPVDIYLVCATDTVLVSLQFV